MAAASIHADMPQTLSLVPTAAPSTLACIQQALLPKLTPMVSTPNDMQSAPLPKLARVLYVVPRPIGRKASTTIWICKTSPCTKGISCDKGIYIEHMMGMYGADRWTCGAEPGVSGRVCNRDSSNMTFLRKL